MQKNKNRPGYKKTKVGWIPEDWECKQFGELAKFLGGNAFSSNDAVDQGVRWLKIANVGVHTVKWDVESYLPASFLSQHNKYALKENDIVMALTRPILDGKLKIAILSDKDEPCLLNQRVARIGAQKGQDPLFLYYLANRAHFIYWMSAMMAGTDPPNIGFSELGFISVPSPSSLPEQEAIAEVLECWDKGIRGYERKIEKKRNIKKGLMQRLLSGKQRLPGFDREWKEVRLGEIVDLIKEKVGDRVVTPMSLSAGIGFVPQAEKFGRDISGEQYQRYTLLPKGCFTYKKGNSKRYPQGCVYLLEDYEEVAVPNVFISFKLHQSEADNGFFRQMFLANMHGRELVRYINSGVRNDGLLNLNTANFLQIKLPLPPVEEQQAIAAVLSSADTEINTLERKLTVLRDQKQFLLNNMVTGTIRLPQFLPKEAS